MLVGDEWMPALLRLTGNENVKVNTFVLKFQQNPDYRRRHDLKRLYRDGERDIWSARVDDDLRVIFHKRGDTFIPIYVDHHDPAYDHARSINVPYEMNSEAIAWNSGDGLRERASAPPITYVAPRLFEHYEDSYLIGEGLRQDWLLTLRQLSSIDQWRGVMDALATDCGDEVALRLDYLIEGQILPPRSLIQRVLTVPADRHDATGEEPEVTISSDPKPEGDPASPHTEALALLPALMKPTESLHLVDIDESDIERMLTAPMETWIAYLHPSQRGVATRSFNGPAKITGGAGTGKTVVAMHRARHLAAQGRHVLLASFTNNARALLEQGVGRLCDGDVRGRIIVRTVHALACDLVRQIEIVNPPEDGLVNRLIAEYGGASGIEPEVLQAEWRHVIQALGITQWEEYRDAKRTGRGNRLSVADRERIWETVIVRVDEILKARKISDWPDICRWAGDLIRAGKVMNPFDAVIVDETQDLGPQELRFLAALAGDGADSLTLVGDAGQRIYPNRTSLRDLGIDVRGRTRTLSLNYRTTEQIYRFAEAILGTEVDDLEGGMERRRKTYSLFTGPEPVTCGFRTPTEQHAFIAAQIARQCAAGQPPGEMTILAQSRYSLVGAETALKQAEIACHILGRDHAASPDRVTLATIHRAKGMEFKSVFVIGASDDAVQRHLPSDADEQQMTLEQERNLLYVGVTRARDTLTVCWVGKPSRFLARALPVTV